MMQKIRLNNEYLEFWENRIWTDFPILGRIVFAVRSSEAAAERSFSNASMRLTPQRNRLSVENLEREVFCRVNAKWRKRTEGKIRKGSKKWRVPAFDRDRAESVAIGRGMNGSIANSQAAERENSLEVIESSQVLGTAGTHAHTGQGACVHGEGIPVTGVGEGSEEKDMFLCCEQCGSAYVDAGPGEEWWRCRNCGKTYCANCCEDVLEDDSGWCIDCTNEKYKRRRRV